MPNKKSKKPNIIISKKTHIGLFFYPFVFFLMTLYYSIFKDKATFFLPLGALLFIFLQFYFMYYGKKIILTDKRIYVYARKKQIISWSLTDDFYFINYEQKKLGNFFNYGTLTLVNHNKEMYNFFHLEACKEVYDKIIIAHEKEMLLLDPNYELRYIQKNDLLDTIEE